jgi:hypothetical protein
MARRLPKMPAWYYAPTQYKDDTETTYCPRHKNRCGADCPYRAPVIRRTPVPLKRVPVGYGQARFGYNYGMFGTEDDMGLSGGGHHHHHGGGGRGYGGYGGYPWWYEPWGYEPVTEVVYVPREPDLDVETSVLGDAYGVLSKKRRPYGSLSRRYKSGAGSLGDNGEYGVLSRRGNTRRFGVFSPGIASRVDCLDSGRATLGAEPSSTGASTGAKVGLGLVAIGIVSLLLKGTTKIKPGAKSTAIVPWVG